MISARPIVPHETRNIVLGIVVILGMTTVYYAFLIFQFPQFYLDDYYIFQKVSVSSLPISVDPSERYYLFVRPVQFFYFWVIYLLSGANAVVMKGFGLLLLSLLLVTSYRVIKRIQKQFTVTIRQSAILMACLFFAFHPDVTSSVLWISNVNEILMTLLYALSIYFLLDEEFATGALALSLLFFLLSSLVKQQSLHYPFLVVFYLVMRWRSLSSNAKRNLIIVAVLGILVVVGDSVVNYLLYVRPSDAQVVESLWKKPFSILGTLFYLVFPVWGVDVYFVFLRHRQVAIDLTLLLLLPALVMAYRYGRQRQRWSPKSLILACVFVLIVFFPRVFVPGGIRLNVIQLFWLALLLSILLSMFPRIKIFVIVGLLVMSIIANQELIAKYKHADLQSIVASLELSKVSRDQSLNTYIVCGPYAKLLEYISYYVSEKKFGHDRNYLYSPVQISSFDLTECDFKEIRVVKNGPVISVSMHDQLQNRMFLATDFASTDKIVQKKHDALRGYEMVEFEPSQVLNDTTVLFVYYDGVQWRKLSD